MNEYDKIAAEIIDLVLDIVEEQNPEIDVEQKEGNSLIYGEPYYDLESKIANILYEKYPKKCHICHKDMSMFEGKNICMNDKCVNFEKGENDD